MIPESPEAYVKLTESAIRNSSGRHQSRSRPPLLTCNPPSPLQAPLPTLSQLCATSMLRQNLLLWLLSQKQKPKPLGWSTPRVKTSVKVKMLVAQSCPTLCDPMACSPPGSSIHGILQARIQEWVAIPSSRGSSRPRDQTWVSHIAGRFFTAWATRGAHSF